MDFRGVLSALTAGEVRFVLVGGVAAAVQGVPLSTFDVDIVQSRDPENARRLAAVLSDLDACYREQLPKRLVPKASDFEYPGPHLLSTRLGPLDVLGSLVGGKGYDDLIARSPIRDFGHGLRVHVLELEVLVEIKGALGREKDRVQLLHYRRTLEELRGRQRPHED